MSVEPRRPEIARPVPSDFRIGDRLVRPGLNRVVSQNATLQLEPKVMQVLVLLADRPGHVVTKEELFRDVWDGAFVTEDVLTRAVGELRRAFEDRVPAWSPDGQRLAFTRSAGGSCRIVLVSALGGEERPLKPCGDLEYRRLAWSPDGLSLAFSRRDGGGPLAIELLSLETLEHRRVTEPPSSILGDSSPAFSPDGRTLAFTRN